MKKYSGFTLIELLVVVLIIGILVAIALPQYNKAVEKARLSEAFHNLKILQDQMDLYFLENGMPNTEDMVCLKDSASVELQGGEWNDDCDYVTDYFMYRTVFNSDNNWIEAERIDSNQESQYQLNILYTPQEGWSYRVCRPARTDLGERTCQSLIAQGWDYAP